MERNGKLDKRFSYYIIAIAALLRLVLFAYNPPNNSFDDYLETIAYYINNNHRPAPSQCWECYQPPLFFFVASLLFKGFFLITSNYYYSWKAVQFLNVLLSILNIFYIYLILRDNFKNYSHLLPLCLAVVAIFPRDIYSAVMISNDPLLFLFVTTSIYYYLAYNRKGKASYFIFLLLCVIGSSLTKQHGLITILFPIQIIIGEVYEQLKTKARFAGRWKILATISSLGLSLGDEFLKFRSTGRFLISNQNFFDYTRNQIPGQLKKINFLSIKLIELLKNPFLSDETVYSFWTVIFGSTWFDYEWRFIAPEIIGAKLLAGILTVFGVVVGIVLLVGVVSIFRTRFYLNISSVMLALVGLGFFLVPMVQTLRFPYFSSMKSLFMLPSLSVFSIVLLVGLNQIKVLRNFYFRVMLITVVLTIGIIHVSFIVLTIHQSLPKLSGPLWQFPFISQF